MNGANDHLSGSISIEDTLDQNGIKAAAKSRAISALDRLVGGLLDLPGAYLDGKARRQRLLDEIENDRIEQLSALRIEHLSEMERLESKARLYARYEQLKDHLNRESIAVEALEDLRDKGFDQSDSCDKSIDEDWLNIFKNYAEKASSESLQLLWGKILSGQIRQPGSFSLTTLRVLSELQRDTAELFQKHASGVFEEQFIPKIENIRGHVLLELTSLEEAGLLNDVAGTLNISPKFDKEGNCFLENKNLGLLCKGSPESTAQIDVIKLSQAGREIYKILPTESPDIALRKISHFLKDISDTMSLVLIDSKFDNGTVSFNVLEKLK